ncbi:hypothetical protein WME79_48990 [Sorangium sp. So ce726]|uniref:hypothetical protein n=1 Tax=Sorangium sp. So ce726 TaxID=3133319 RepID=UPI003F63373E
MRMFEHRSWLGWMVLAAAVVVGCSDDSDADNNGSGGGGAGSATSSSSSGKGAGGSDNSSGGSGGSDNSSGGSDNSSGGSGGSGDETGGAGGGGSTSSGGGAGEGGGSPSPFPAVPEVLSLTGCNALGLGPLCSVTQEDGSLRANCSGKIYTGSVSEDGDIRLASEDASVGTVCEGKLTVNGVFKAACARTTGEATETCELSSDPVILPGLPCMELPAVIDDLVICSEGAGAGGETIKAGDCKVIQDGCVFQAECADKRTITGSVNRTGVAFTQVLTALADAQTPNAGTPEAGTPAFLKGAKVNHSCTATLDDATLKGSCGAGSAGRGGTNTSVCASSGAFEPVAACGPLSPSAGEYLFVLDSCDILKNGEGAIPGIGEPVCAFRQNNCIWDVRCGNDPAMAFAGRAAPADRKVKWRLATGTPCEAGFDASGRMTGKCTVPGEEACQLTSKAAVPGGDDCPALPAGTDFYSNGCGGGDPLDCRAALQHGCNFMALCDFSSRNQFLAISGEASYQDERAHLEFNGVGDYKCYVDQATAAEIESGDRAENEWYGQCTNSAGGQCRNNYNPETGTGYRGLRLYFE